MQLAPNFLPPFMNARTRQIRLSNIDAAITLCESLGTSLGPRGADKMITDSRKKTIITNDGATILKTLKAGHPILQILCSLSQTQDRVCGDGTTTVVILVGALLKQLRPLIEKGVHVSQLCDVVEEAKAPINEAVRSLSIPLEAESRAAMVRAAVTALSSKVVSMVSDMSEIAVDAVLAVKGDMTKIKVMKKLGGGLEDTQLCMGCVLKKPEGFSRKRCRVALAQFCLSAPKTNIDSKVVLSSAEMMESVINEERAYILDLCRAVKKKGIDLLVVQKSLLRESCSDLAAHFLKKFEIAVVNDVEREEIEFLSKNLGIKPVSDVRLLSESKIREVAVEDDEDLLKITEGDNVTIVVRGGDTLVLDEAERSLNDALWVVKSLVDEPFLVPGGGTVEMCVSRALFKFSMRSRNPLVCLELSRAFEAVPFLLAKNAGLHAVDIVSELRDTRMGVNVRLGCVGDMAEEEVVQPMKVSLSAIELALETVITILMVDDILPSSR